MSSLDHYESKRELGRGGMGKVFLAHDPKLGRDVAVKVLTGWRPDPDAMLRFAREAEVTARLRHPHIVAVHAVGTYKGQPGIVMEWVDGESLQDRIKRGPLDPREAARLLAQVAEAVEFAHGQGVLHRDLKPANVMIRDGEALLTDFGLAKDLADSRDRLTRSGEILGTPAFMPPEQVEGGTKGIGTWSDVYGLGATLYAALSARPPFQAPGVMTVLNKVLNESPPPLGEAVPAGLHAICERSLAKLPEERYPSAGALGADLKRFVSGEVLETPGPSVSPFVLAFLALCALVAFAAFASRPAQGPGRPQAPTSEPSPTEPERRALSAREQREGDRALRRLSAQPPRKRYRALGAWLQSYPGHPREEEARGLREEARCSFAHHVFEAPSGTLHTCGVLLGAPEAEGVVLLGTSQGLHRYAFDGRRIAEAWRPAGLGVNVLLHMGSSPPLLRSGETLLQLVDLAADPVRLDVTLPATRVPRTASHAGARTVAFPRVDGLGWFSLNDPSQAVEVRSTARRPDYQVLTFLDRDRLLAARAVSPTEGVLELWSVSERRLLKSVAVGSPRDLRVSPNGKRVALAAYSSSGRGVVEVFNDRLELQHTPGHVGEETALATHPAIGMASIHGIAFSPDGRLLHFLASDHERLMGATPDVFGERESLRHYVHGTWDLEGAPADTVKTPHPRGRELTRISHPDQAELPAHRGLVVSEDRRWGLLLWKERAELWGLPTKAP